MVVEPVVGNAEQPGGECGVGFPPGAGVDHLLPDVLEQFLGQRPVAQLAQQIVEKPGAVARIKLRKRF
ncbi:hypothetical protein D9M71_771660 [compost metagenome]